MDNDTARRVLLLFRPGCGDEADPDVQAALKHLQQNPELQRWFDQHCAFQTAARRTLREVPVPAGLRQRILSGNPGSSKIVWWRRAAFQGPALAAAAALVLLLGMWWLWLPQPPRGDFTAYREKMVSQVLREYAMDLVTTNVTEIREFLSSHPQALTDYELTPPLENTPVKGCGLLRWRGRPVTMVCFQSGQQELFLFVTNRAGLPGTPAEERPELAPVKRLMTASWTKDGKTYVLAAKGDEASLRRLL